MKGEPPTLCEAAHTVTRERRLRQLPTDHAHAGSTRGYQNDHRRRFAAEPTAALLDKVTPYQATIVRRSKPVSSCVTS